MSVYPSTTLLAWALFQTAPTPLSAGKVAFDPTVVSCTITDPQGNQTFYTFGISGVWTNPQVGYYSLQFEGSLESQWTAKFYGATVIGGVTVDVTGMGRIELVAPV